MRTFEPTDREPGRDTTPTVVGRDAEMLAIAGFLARATAGPAALVFEGAPGIGKTTVWACARERAQCTAVHLLSCRPVDAEAKLAFASLADLLEPVAERALPLLAEPQRLALEVALLRTNAQGSVSSPRVVAAATLSVLRLLAAEGPLVIAVDDQQWIDRASADALAFALRRIGDLPVGVVTSLRVGDGDAADPLGLAAAFGERLERRPLGPLTSGALHHVVRQHLGRVLPRPTLLRVTDASRGNPFYALEITRELLAAKVHPGPGDPLPVSDSVMALVLRRLERLPARVREVLLVTAALFAPRLDTVRGAIGARADDAIERALRARVVELDGPRLRFTHPLLASAVYASALPARRRDVHRLLAGTVTDPEERARHLALATESPDESVAAALDEAALLARRRGAPDAAGELQERAANLTPPDDPAGRRARTLRAAEHFFHAGDRARARALLTPLLDGEPSPDERARALQLLGRIRGEESSFPDAIDHLREALACATEPELRAAIQLDLGFAANSVGDLPEAVRCVRAARAAAEALGNPGLLADALAMEAMAAFYSGNHMDGCRQQLERARTLEDRSRATLLTLRPTALAAQFAIYEGRLNEAETPLHEIVDWATERGEDGDLPFLLVHFCGIAWFSGDGEACGHWAEQAISLCLQTGNETTHGVALAYRAQRHAFRGEVDEARAALAEGRLLVARSGFVGAGLALANVAANLELSLGDFAAAERAIGPIPPAVLVGEPFNLLSELVEARVGLGQLDEAAALLEPYAEQVRTNGRRWLAARTDRGEALLSAARGDLDTALAVAQRSIATLRTFALPIDLGRSLLVEGQVLRRRSERRVAKDAFDEALTLFERHGARLWHARAVEELRRVPIRRGAPADLTETEARVAEQAAAGRMNREIAATLFLSVKTVEANLGRIYAKLGIRGRAELGVALRERGWAGQAKK
jgi:DNA-binding CsgD family transcriptional regulator